MKTITQLGQGIDYYGLHNNRWLEEEDYNATILGLKCESASHG